MFLNFIFVKLFNFDVTSLNWKNYVTEYVIGAKVHLMKEDISKAPACRKRLLK